MPREIVFKVRLPTKEEVQETVKKLIEQLEGVVAGSVEIVELGEARTVLPTETTKPSETHDITVTSTPQPETGTPPQPEESGDEQPPDTGTGEQK